MTIAKPKGKKFRPSLAMRMKANQRAQIARLNELDKTDTLGREDATFRRLRREWDTLDKEWDRKNAKRLSRHPVTVYGSSTGKTSLQSLVAAERKLRNGK